MRAPRDDWREDDGEVSGDCGCAKWMKGTGGMRGNGDTWNIQEKSSVTKDKVR